MGGHVNPAVSLHLSAIDSQSDRNDHSFPMLWRTKYGKNPGWLCVPDGADATKDVSPRDQHLERTRSFDLRDLHGVLLADQQALDLLLSLRLRMERDERNLSLLGTRVTTLPRECRKNEGGSSSI